jgi:hypothetical protein
MLGREEPSSASRAEDTRVPSGSMRLAVLVLAEVACPTTARLGYPSCRVRPQFTSLRTGARQYLQPPSVAAPCREPSAALGLLAPACLGNLIGIDIRIGMQVRNPHPPRIVVVGRREGRPC